MTLKILPGGDTLYVFEISEEGGPRGEPRFFSHGGEGEILDIILFHHSLELIDTKLVDVVIKRLVLVLAEELGEFVA